MRALTRVSILRGSRVRSKVSRVLSRGRWEARRARSMRRWAAHVAFLVDQGQQELLVRGRIGAGLLGDLRKAAAHGRQAQLLEPVLQQLARVSSGHDATAWAHGADDSKPS